MSTSDVSLRAYVRSRLQNHRPSPSMGQVDALLVSPQFRHLKNKFDSELDRLLEKYFGPAQAGAGGASAPPPPALPYVMKELKVTEAKQTQPTRAGESDAAATRPAPPVATAPAAATVPAGAAPPAVPAPQPAAPVPAPVPTIPVPATPPAPPAVPELPDTTFRLPSARAGDAYAQPIEAIGAPGAILYDALTPPDGLALALDPAAGTVGGTPGQAGDYDMVLTYRYAGQPGGRPRQATLKLVVNANPKAMWRDLPSDQGDLYWRPDQRCSRLDDAHDADPAGHGLRMLAASKRGRSHAHVGGFRDDEYVIAAMPAAGWRIAVVADGAGSARYSRKGAAIICEEARKTLESALEGERGPAIDRAAEAYQQARGAPKTDPAHTEALWQTLRNALYGAVGNAAYYAAKGIADESARRKETDAAAAFRDYSSTALIAICKRYPFGTLCAAYWVGDGAVAIYSRRDGVILLGDVDSGEYSGQTRFLESAEVTQEALLRRTRFEIVDDMTALVLMSDGVSDPKFETEARLARADDWHRFWDELAREAGLDETDGGQERKLLDWLDFWSQGNHDDRTIAIIY